MSFADGERTAVAQVLGPVGSGALSVAADSARRLLSSKFWSSAICVGMQVCCLCAATADIDNCLQECKQGICSVRSCRKANYLMT